MHARAARLVPPVPACIRVDYHIFALPQNDRLRFQCSGNTHTPFYFDRLECHNKHSHTARTPPIPARDGVLPAWPVARADDFLPTGLPLLQTGPVQPEREPVPRSIRSEELPAV